jgi:hypothetical protein
MPKLNNIIGNMSYKELNAIEHDLYEGNIGKLIKHRKEAFESYFNEKICPTCGNTHKGINEGYTLFFGPKDFRKKASFCGLDCLSYYVEKLRKNKSTIQN